ncbi:hypothetical protein S7711_03659 [Stachybotrys chartarum IBT 7711]|uniref:Glucose-methanol-choline oxidoreductase N-terminal domain-containing protein n=1 Tax=Stachybotrys chartarum (strain CBS 109288 / IBT 7711) TaxID=1280523 RepID=A0A084B7G2_STACB|nr:hypothetical protein S7711_03659 [Stachybotrys chartarum IBT 7711]KFA50125.1 hypothetical protein S40293_06384 [Stachybotrys chartarum IBT 40293]
MFPRAVAILAAASGLVAAATAGDRGQRNYDYVIVGGGTAGLGLATRLSLGLPHRQILVIEAGAEGFDDPEIYIPGMRTRAVGGEIDWNLTSIPQQYSNDRIVNQPRGKVLGGSSALNFITHNRASLPEYDWEALGNEGWDADTFFAAMLKSENYTGVGSQHYGTEGVGYGGPIQTVINRVIADHQEAWIPTFNNLGIETNLESMGGDVNGVMYQFNTISADPWVRSYSANAYLPLAGPNLHVMTETRVAKINLSGKGRGNKRATGVTLVDGRVIRARREVIVSAGSLQTPQLLELSGIGRSDVLAAAGIKQLINLPGVGENLQDHVRVQVNVQLREGLISTDLLRTNMTFDAEQLERYRAGEPGLYDYSNSGFSFTNWEQAVGPDRDLELKALAESVEAQEPALQTMKEWMNDPVVPQVEIIYSNGYVGSRFPAVGSELYGVSFISFVGCLMHPLSRGSVHIRSSNIEDAPLIDPNYLAEPYDLEALVEIVKYSRRVAQTEPMRSNLGAEYEPGPEVVTDDEIREYVRQTVVPVSHPTSTAALLPREDGGVVDARLRVYGTDNLRIVDASIMPVLVSAHITSAVYGIAERAADIILEDARR